MDVRQKLQKTIAEIRLPTCSFDSKCTFFGGIAERDIDTDSRYRVSCHALIPDYITLLKEDSLSVSYHPRRPNARSGSKPDRSCHESSGGLSLSRLLEEQSSCGSHCSCSLACHSSYEHSERVSEDL